MCHRDGLLPRDWPGRLARLAAFPQGKIHRMTFALIHIDPCTGLEVFQLALRKAPVVRILVDLEVHVAVDGIGQALLDQPVRDLDDLGNVLGGFRLYRRRHDSQLTHVLVVGIDIFARNRVTGDTLFIARLMILSSTSVKFFTKVTS